jgi:hypothetical protein
MILLFSGRTGLCKVQVSILPPYYSSQNEYCVGGYDTLLPFGRMSHTVCKSILYHLNIIFTNSLLVIAY